MNRERERMVGKDRRVRHKWIGAAALVWASWGLVGTLHAATIIVTTTQDGPVGNVAGCSLREAVHAINTQANGNGCTNASTQAYGANDRIRFAAGVNNIALTLLPNPLATSALSIQRPVEIRGRGRATTIISGGGGEHILLDNATRLTLRSLSLVNAGTALKNEASASATLLLVHASGHQRRAIINLGRMTLTLVRVTDNPGGGVANGNATPVQSLGEIAQSFVAMFCSNRDCCNNQCPGPVGNSGSSGPSFPVGQAPAGLVVTRSRIAGNGPIACAGIVNGGGMVQGSSGIGGIGNPLVDMKIEGALTLRQSRVSGNTAGAADGGGICNLSVAAIVKSEISGNSAARGAGVLVRPATQTLTLNARPVTLIADTTISSNVASIAGGGIFAESLGGSIRLQFTTITANSAGGGAAQHAGGVATDSGVAIDATATVVAGNTASAAAAANADCASTTLTGGHNFMPSSSSGTCSMSGANNQNSGNPGLGPLTAVTSATRAHVPIATSVLVDRVPTSSGVCGGRDQRNLVRPRDGNGDGSASCDRGAVER